MKVVVVPHMERSSVREVGRRFVEEARRAGLTPVADAEAADLVGADPADLSEAVPDLVVAVGGDGTMLSAVRLALRKGVPVLGVNLGTVGFLAEVEPYQVTAAVEALAAGRWSTVDRMTIQARLPNGEVLEGVNDVVVEKIESQRLIAIDVEFDGEPYLRYRADGLIFATPTGSTAYAFSAGGPLVDPLLEAIILTPVAAHSLFARSLVLPPHVVVTCRVADDRPERVSVDGAVGATLGQGDTIEIRKGDRPARFVTLDGRSFPGTIKRKFRLD